jgi:hypothetical protein
MQSALADEQVHLGGAANAGAKDDATVKLRKADVTREVRIFMKSSERSVENAPHFTTAFGVGG